MMLILLIVILTFTIHHNTAEKNAEYGQFAAHVSIVHDEQHICGGVVLSEYFILTAAHCVFHIPKDLIVVTGRIETEEFPEDNVHNVIKTIIHPQFSFATRDYDIALMQINKRITGATPNTGFIDIKADYHVTGGEIATMVYWKPDSDGDSDVERLVYRDIVLWEPNTCKPASVLIDIILNIDKEPLTNEAICADLQTEFCIEDDTGTLLYEGSLLGIGTFNFNCYDSEKPIMFTNLVIFKAWIESYLQG